MRYWVLEIVVCGILLTGFSRRSVVNADLSGPELAKLMKIGTRVVRGKDWSQEKHGNQDGGPGHEGFIIRGILNGKVRAEWESGKSDTYFMGYQDKYELDLAPTHTATTTVKAVVTTPTLSGPQLFARMKDGIRVVRSKDWDWEDQDNPEKVGKVVEVDKENQHVVVQWDNGLTYAYRMGYQGKYDIELAPNP